MLRLSQVHMQRLQRSSFLSSVCICFALLVLAPIEVKNGVIHVCVPFADALIVTVPSGASDYRQLASLLVSTFDAPPSTKSPLNNGEMDSLQSKLDLLQWNLYDKSLTEQYTYKQYTSTVKRMWGKKYCLFVAKEYIPHDEENGSRSSHKVVGMVEMGMSIGPAVIGLEDLSADGENITSSDRIGNPNFPYSFSVGLRPRATVGVLCVEPKFQKQGVGQALLKKCEEVADDVWHEDSVFVDVEPNNVNAMTFFERCGYDTFVDETGNIQMRNAIVSRRRVSESRPHIILSKRFTKAEEDCLSDNALIDSH